MRRCRLAVVAIVLAGLLSGCATTRVAYTADEADNATIPGIPAARLWSDDTQGLKAAIGEAKGSPRLLRHPTLLAISGGGAEGAYGAGFLTCWSRTGTRPQFTVVTGTSVGALIAPFAFLGPAYDSYIRQMFTSGETSGLLQFAGFPALFGSSLYRGAPLRELVDHYVDQRLLAAIATQYRRGRRLMVVTTDLDNQRTALWDMGRIASSGAPNALALFRSVLLASAAIPGVFPPELITAEANGKYFTEMHVDGGVTANVLVVPEAILTSSTSVAPGVHPDLYVVVNGKLAPSFTVAKSGAIDIFARAFETSLWANTRNTLIATAEYARRHGWKLHTTAIPPDAPNVEPIDFDTHKMRALFDIGCRQALGPDRWSTDAAG